MIRASDDGNVVVGAALSGHENRLTMRGQNSIAVVSVMNEHDDEIIEVVTEKFERRLAEECGALRVDMQQGFGAIRVEMHQGFGALRVEMADRNAELMKWALVFGTTQTAAIAGIVALLR